MAVQSRSRSASAPFACAGKRATTGTSSGERFCDEQVRGPFRIWRHTHRFVAVGTDQTLYEDRVEYALQGGRLVARLAQPVVRLLLARMFARRHQTVRAAFADARDAALRRRVVTPGITSVERLRIVR